MTRKRMFWLVEAILLLVVFLGYGTTVIEGDSMVPSLEDGDLLVYARRGPYARGDIVIFHVPSMDRNLIKRIAREPGKVHPELPGVRLDEDEYYVLGDNPEVSLDSRNPAIGLVTRDLIKGRALFRIWPLDKWGRIGG